MRKGFLLLLLLLLLLTSLACPALADDVYTVKDATAITSCTTDLSYLRVKCPLQGQQNVTMTIRDEWGSLVYQRDYGLCSNSFRSEDVYLPLNGGQTRYTVTLQTGNSACSFHVTREMARLTDSGVYACGLPLSQITSARSNKYAVIIDTDAMEGSTFSVPLVSGSVQLGQITFTLQGGVLSGHAQLYVDGSIDKATVYVARDAVTANTLGTKRFSGNKLRSVSSIDLRGTPYAALMIQLTVSYDASTAQAWQMDRRFADDQYQLWLLMQMTTANEAVG